VRTLVTPDDLAGSIGLPLGSSGWHRITQQMVDRFAEATHDEQWIHVDPERAAVGPFGTTIAHGFLVVALLPALLAEVVRFEGCGVVINSGADRVRFTSPVPVGSRIRARFAVAGLRARPRGFQELTYDAWCDIEAGAESVCSAGLTLLYQRTAGISETSVPRQPERTQ
jgi:acyl dehydratase